MSFHCVVRGVRAALGSDDVDAVEGRAGSEQPGEVGDDEPGGKGGSDWAYSWVPIVGPLIGAVAAGLIVPHFAGLF